MYLQRLSIVNYRNIGQADLEFPQGINCFVGPNGSGKTNILDAVYYLSFCKSFQNPVDSQNVQHGQDFFMLQGWYEKTGGAEEVYCGFKLNQKKQFKRNKKEYPRLADHIGFIPLVSVSPADEMLVNEGSESRRKFMDSVISQYDKRYLDDLIRYARVLMQRNKLLKEMAEGNLSGQGVVEVMDMQLTALAKSIHKARIDFLDEFLPVFNMHFADISGGAETVGLTYHSHLDRPGFEELLVQNLKRDTALGYTSKGIHKDDLEFVLDGHPLKREGSQGQKKSFVISLKLAQFDFLARHQGVKPILLLDDIFDKLDEDRGQSLLQMVSENHFNQIFVTHTHREALLAVLKNVGKEIKLFSVGKGEVEEDKTLK
ncbi:MAG: DNA replication and repair protein RecF [Breznakibacter sp.]